MNAHREGLSLIGHETLGAELHRVQERLGHLSFALSGLYGSGSKLSRRAHAADTAVSRLRCGLDEQVLRDHPDQFRPEVYYPDWRLRAEAEAEGTS